MRPLGTPTTPETELQHVGDILICSPTKQDSDATATLALNFSGEKGCHISPSKAQIFPPTIKCLICHLAHGSLSIDWKKAILNVVIPQTKRGKNLLGKDRFLQNFDLQVWVMAKPCLWGNQGTSFRAVRLELGTTESLPGLKQALTEGLALGLHNLEKPFTLFVAERQRIALGVVTPKLGNIPRPGYILNSRTQLPVWAVAVLMEASELTLG